MDSKLEVEIVNLSGQGLSQEECRKASVWMAKSFALAPAEPALNIFFGDAPYETTRELHESFWASHLNRVAHSGYLLGAKVQGAWRGFRCFFPPGEGRLPYVTDFRLGDGQGGNGDWDRFLGLAGEKEYMNRIQEWGRMTGETNREIGLDPSGYFTTSIIVTDRDFQRCGIGRALDSATQKIVRVIESAKERGSPLHVRIHEYILSFYSAQGYRVIASPTYTLLGSSPFQVHFLLKG